MDAISSRLKDVRTRLVAQSKDALGMDDYKAQMVAYQHIFNDHLLLSIELATLVEEAIQTMQAQRADD